MASVETEYLCKTRNHVRSFREIDLQSTEQVSNLLEATTSSSSSHQFSSEFTTDHLLQDLSLAAQELSEEQLTINNQLQQDELLAMEAIYGDYLTVLTREGNRSFQIHVHLEGSDEFTISAKLPSFDKNVKYGENPSRSITAVDDLNSHLYTFKVTHLPPIVLTCLFPNSYPSHQPPYFTISSQWLDSLRISNLCLMLDSLWTKQPGQEIMYQWVEWLHSSSLPFLGFETEIILDYYSFSNAGDSRAVSGSVSPDVDILSMMNYNEDRCHEGFLGNMHDCVGIRLVGTSKYKPSC